MRTRRNDDVSGGEGSKWRRWPDMMRCVEVIVSGKEAQRVEQSVP